MGSDFTQFMQQPFVSTLFSLMCLLALLLLVTVAALVVVRRRKARQVASASSSYTHPPASYASGDMPDLDALVSTTSQPRPAPTAAAAAPPTRSARKGTFSVTLADGGSAEVVEVLAVLRDVDEGALIVQIGDKAYRSIQSDAALKERVTKVMRELAQFASARPAESAPAPAETSPAVQPPPIEASTPPAPQPTPKPTALPVKPTGEAKMPGDLPSFKLDDQGPIKPARGQKREAKPIPEINIAAAIEAYLQHKLARTPEYAGRSIHIYPAPDGGVSIEVDGAYFEAVGDVADPDVREFLAATIQEWQDRH